MAVNQQPYLKEPILTLTGFTFNNDVNLNAPCIYTDLFMLTIKESDFKIQLVRNLK